VLAPAPPPPRDLEVVVLSADGCCCFFRRLIGGLPPSFSAFSALLDLLPLPEPWFALVEVTFDEV